MIFILNGRMEFEAEDLDDAFIQLAGHFIGCYRGDPASKMIPNTSIHIFPKNSEDIR